MPAYFAIDYTIHFDDTMSYGGHHFLTSFKFQCAAREAFLFGERVFDVPGVKQSLDRVHLFTADAYSRNLQSMKLGDRVAILMTIEDWGRASARFCYRVLDSSGQKVGAGFQNLICADAETGNPMPLPSPLRDAMDSMREIEEPHREHSFRHRVLAGGAQLDSLFTSVERDTAIKYLSQRYPKPMVIPAVGGSTRPRSAVGLDDSPDPDVPDIAKFEALVFAGQGAFDARLLSERVRFFLNRDPLAREELDHCAAIVNELIGKNSGDFLRGSAEDVAEAVESIPELGQVAIHLQNVLGAAVWRESALPTRFVMGHSFGEIAAFGVGGCFDLATGVRIVCLRGKAIETHGPPDGGLLAVFAQRHWVEIEAKLLELDQVVVAGRNHDRQTIVSGPRAQLDRLKSYLQNVGVGTANVSSPTSFHHPQMQAAAAHWLEQLRRLPFHPCTQMIYSPIGRRLVTPGDDVPAILASQLVCPFDLKGAILDLVGAGVTRFVDCGSTGSLAALISKSLPDGVIVCRPEKSEMLVSPEPIAKSQSPSSAKFPITKLRLGAVDDEPVRNPDRLNGREIEAATESNPASVNPFPEVAIVGRGCILPGGARSPTELMATIRERRTGIVDYREIDRFWQDDFYSATLVPDRSTSHLCGRVNDVDIVVPSQVDPRVFDRFTRTQKLLCIALSACADSLKGAERVTCLIGATADGFEDQDEVSSLDYSGIDPTDDFVDQRMNTVRSASRTPHDAVQEVFDRIIRPGLQVTLIDAACASSLYSVALGMRLLESDQADAVIAGGVFCPGPGNSCLFSQFRGTTSTGCRPFDANADGVVFSEGAAVVTLRRTTDAERMGLSVSAIVRGSGLSSDGRSSSANVPQSSGQIRSLERCYKRYGIAPSSIDAIEGHGTSTPVGDSTELQTLRTFFSEHVSKPIPIHSLKATIGHAGWAAGTASVIAVCEYFQAGTFPSQACFQQPSPALIKSRGVLAVASRPVSLTSKTSRIAINGFGFGGANAHLVLEAYQRPASGESVNLIGQATHDSDDDEVVIVAHHHQSPTQASPSGFRFDRGAVKLPKEFVILPELAEDMDISQILAVTLTNQIISKVPNFDSATRSTTSLVLAMNGKTERGVEATLRVMSQRIRRNLAGNDRFLKAVDAACQRARPSKAYTLQCMMPNVAAGRAALLHNLNGPNFVVDCGSDSFSAAVQSASLLLRGGDVDGTNFAIVAAIEARSAGASGSQSTGAGDEYALAVGLTKRSFAKQQGWDVIATIDELFELGNRPATTEHTCRPAQEQIENLVSALSRHSQRVSKKADAQATTAGSPTNGDCRLHTPVWVEKRATATQAISEASSSESFLAIVPADAKLVAEMVAGISAFAARHLVAVVGQASHDVLSSLNASNAVAVDLSAIREGSAVLNQIFEFKPDIVAAIQTPRSWDFLQTLSSVANDNSLCELLFLIAKQNIQRIDQGALELWSLVVEGWRGQVHPSSGAIAGLLKSIHREMPASRVGSICTRGGGLATAIQNLIVERSLMDSESEVVYDESVRLVRRLRPTMDHGDATPLVRLNEDSVILASGGARGVTAVLLEALLSDHRCHVIMLGRSAPEAGPENADSVATEEQFYQRFMRENPSAAPVQMKRAFALAQASWEAHRTLQRLTAIGGHVEYQVVDVTDREQVASAIEQIKSRYGKVDLLIHGAGVQVSKRLEHRSLAEFRKTYAVKVLGLEHLTRCCQEQFGSVVCAHILTSAYSIFGNDGQHDYCAANEAMDRMAGLSWDHLAMRWSSIAWLGWDGIGMTRGTEYRALAKARSLSGIDPPTGQKLFRSVMAGRTAAAINVPVSHSEHVEYRLRTIPVQRDASAGRILEVAVDLSKVKCLPFHKVKQCPTLPGAWILDCFIRAAMQLYPDSHRIVHATIQDTSFMRLVRYRRDQNPNVRVIVEESGQTIQAWLVSDVLHAGGRTLSRDVLCARATLTFAWESSRMEASSVQSIAESWSASDASVEDPYCMRGPQDVDLSGPFNCLKEVRIGGVSRRARLSGVPDCEWTGNIPALALDAAWRVGAMHAVPRKDHLYVPTEIRRMVISVEPKVQLGDVADWAVRSTNPTPERGSIRWDFTEVLDPTGERRIVIEDALAKRLDS